MTPQKRRFGFTTKAALYILTMGILLCAAVYPLALREYDKQFKAYAAALREVGTDGVVCVCGSLYLVGTFKKMLLGLQY